MNCKDQICLRWDNHQGTLLSAFKTFMENDTLVDCVLAAEGRFLNAHKVVLSACSPYFASLLSHQPDKYPILILKDVKFHELQAMLNYMYKGEVHASENQLADLLKVGKSLEIKSLSASHDESAKNNDEIIQNKCVVQINSAATECDRSTSDEDSLGPRYRKRKIRALSVELKDNHDELSHSSNQTQNNNEIVQNKRVVVKSDKEGNSTATECDRSTSDEDSPRPRYRKRKFRVASVEVTDNHDPLSHSSNQANDDKDIGPSAQQQKQDIIGITKGMKASQSELLSIEIEPITLNKAEVLENFQQTESRQGNEGSTQRKVRGRPSDTEEFIIAKFGKSSRGNCNLLHNGYTFSKHKSLPNQSVYWECCRHSLGCKARAITKDVNGTIMMKLSKPKHTH